MDDKEYMSGCQLRQYLHISTRKMKYLMEHNYIPHENTGHATHKYRVKREDAETFRLRMEQEPNFLRELSGQFSSRKTRSPKRPMIDPTEENCREFEAFLTDLWAELPSIARNRSGNACRVRTSKNTGICQRKCTKRRKSRRRAVYCKR